MFESICNALTKLHQKEKGSSSCSKETIWQTMIDDLQVDPLTKDTFEQELQKAVRDSRLLFKNDLYCLAHNQKEDEESATERIKLDDILLPKGWRTETTTRKSGGTKGRQDLYWYSPGGKKFRSKLEVKRFLAYDSPQKGEVKKTQNSDSKLKRKRSSPSSRPTAKRARTIKKTTGDSVSKTAKEAWVKYVNDEDNIIDINLKVPYISKEGLLEAVLKSNT